MRFPSLLLAACMLAGCAGMRERENPDPAASSPSLAVSSAKAPAYSARERMEIARLAATAHSSGSVTGSGSSSILALRSDEEVVKALLETAPVSRSSGGVIALSKEQKLALMVADFDRRAVLQNGDGAIGAIGIARASWSAADGYTLFASFTGLPTASGGTTYEGWLVQSKPFMAKSAGRIEDMHGAKIIVFASAEDLRAYDRFILTVQSSDSAAAPGTAILEGAFTSVD